MVQIGDKYSVSADAYCYTLYRNTTTKKGKPVRSVLGYYGTLQKALKALFDIEAREIVGSGEKTLSQALYEVRQASCELAKVIEASVPGAEVIIKN